MNKILASLLIIGICMTSSVAFADQDYQERNVFNRMTDWQATILKPTVEKQQIIDQRVERRANRRKAHVTFNQKKHELTENYHHELLSISEQNISAEEMAKKLKDADSNHKMKLQELEKQMYE